jgi:MATE family multidrug resistance protein
VIRVELAHVLRLALPIILTQLSQMGMGVADTIMAGRYSATDLAGVALGGTVFWPSILLLSGIMMALIPSVSQLHGGGNQAGAGEVVRQAAWIGLGGGILLMWGYRNLEPVYRLVGVDEAAIPIAVDYLAAFSWGVPPLMGYFALRYLCEGMSWTLPAMLVAFFGLLAKIPLNYLFIYGGLGIPAMGGAGCGWASTLVIWLEFAVLAWIVSGSRLRATGVFSRFSRPDPAELWRLVKLGLPIGLSSFLEISMFSTVTLLVGRFGAEAVAAHQIAVSVGGLAFMIPMAIGMAASIRVGYNVGAGDLPGARRSGQVAIGVSLVFAVLAAALILPAREVIAGLYTTQMPVLLLAAELMIFVALYQFVDDTQVAAIGSLRGYKDTRVPMIVALLAYWAVGLPVGVLFGFDLVGVPELEGVRGFWVGLCAGLAVASVFLILRFAWLSRRPDVIVRMASR